MPSKLVSTILVVCVVLAVAVYTINVYFLNRLDASTAGSFATAQKLEYHIRRTTRHLKPNYLNRNPRFFGVRNKLLRNLQSANYENASTLWEISHWWPKNNEIYPLQDSSMGQLLKALRNEPIIAARNAPRGTQLKLLLTLTGKQKVIFKPKWYEPDEIIPGVVYAGKDRHRAEIVAFYLGAVLNLRWTPIAVGRRINLQLVEERSDKDLKNTITTTVPEEDPENPDQPPQMCVYGKCHYCKESEPACADANHMLEGVVLQLIPGSFSKYRSPWQRTYKELVKADWETNMNFCDIQKAKVAQPRLLDLIDVAVFDFLIQNGDRHHYETRNDRVVLVDNGKGFGHPHIDHLDILAPLYQCCIMRKSTWERLQMFSGGTLTEFINLISKDDHLYPLLTDQHFRALERRMLLVYGAVEYCMGRFGEDIFDV